MYSLFLVLCVAAVILSPLALDLVLNIFEARSERRRVFAPVQEDAPDIAWASPRMH